ncbi:MAG: RlmE family RNA methyltransferase, partial [Alphaproteobacteria bacterium]|nr:RlmE family RNA methyltransferase [Alphaproteobacteria bacterium]
MARKRKGGPSREGLGRRDAGPLTRRSGIVRVKGARGRTPSSTAWLSRQLNDPYVAEARRRGYRSRAAFKLIELNDRFRLLLPGRRIVDLGCAPGGWTQVAVERAGDGSGRGKVVGVDLADTAPIPGATILRADIRDPGVTAMIRD